jgi:plastocyanin
MKSKPIGIFGVLTLVAILGIAPHAFAATTQVVMSPGAGSDQTCVAAKNCFSPNMINIAPGDTVTWTNNDKVGHTTTSGLPTDNQTGTVWDSSLVKAGGTYSFTFQTAGDYKYFCQVHPWMSGEVIVGAAASSSSGSSGSASSSMNMPSGSSMSNSPSSKNTTSPAQSGQGQQGGIPLGSSYNAPASNAPASNAPASNAPASNAPASNAPASSTSVPTGVTYNDSDNPYGPLSGMTWALGLAAAGVMSGIGVWTAVRRR